MFVANHLHALALAEAGFSGAGSLGLSLGEYNHLVHIGAIHFLDALRLVDARGGAYDEGPPGCMVAIFPLSRDELEPLLANTDATLANLNSPMQHVVAGSHEDVAVVCRRVEEETFATQRVIESAIPMHHASFAPVAERLGAALAEAPWRSPTLPYISNVLGGPAPCSAPDSIAALLKRHVCEPVFWRDCIASVLSEDAEAVLVEVGPGTILHDLGRRWAGCVHLHTADRGALERTVETLRGGDHGG